MVFFSSLFVSVSLPHTHTQVQSYIQTLWKEIDPNETVLYNGAVEALITLLGAISAFIAGLLNSQSFNRYEIWILTALMLIEGSLLFWAALTTSLWCCYISYVIFGMIYHFTITVARYRKINTFINYSKLIIYAAICGSPLFQWILILIYICLCVFFSIFCFILGVYSHMLFDCSASVAKKLHEECFALIFGINTLMALILQSMLTFIVITRLNLALRTQYQLYSYLFFVLAIIYGVIGVAKLLIRPKQSYHLKWLIFISLSLDVLCDQYFIMLSIDTIQVI